MALINLVVSLHQNVVHHPLQTLAVATFLTIISYFIANEFVRYAARIPGLKGPRGLPVIGNLWDIRTNAAEQYRSWVQTYGGVYQIQLGNIPVVVVNTAAGAKKLKTAAGPTKAKHSSGFDKNETLLLL